MSVIAIDASSLAKYILREENWRDVRDHLMNEVFSLNLALAEVSNAIWKHNVLYGEVSKKQADKMFKALEKLRDVVIFEPFEKYLGNAVKIAMDKKITVYDALYITQAKVIGKLITSEDKQKRVAKELGIDVIFIE